MIQMGTARHCERYTHTRLMTRFVFHKEAKQSVRDAIKAGISHDLGSESNVDVCVITKNRMDYITPFDEANLNSLKFKWKYLLLFDL